MTKKKIGVAYNYFFILKIGIFPHSSLHIKVMRKDSTFPRVSDLAHQESGGLWWSEALLTGIWQLDCENASLP